MNVYKYVFYTIFYLYKKVWKSDSGTFTYAISFFSMNVFISLFLLRELVFEAFEVRLFHYDNFIITVIILAAIFFFNYLTLIWNKDYKKNLRQFGKKLNKFKFTLVILYVIINIAIALNIGYEKRVENLKKTATESRIK